MSSSSDEEEESASSISSAESADSLVKPTPDASDQDGEEERVFLDLDVVNKRKSSTVDLTDLVNEHTKKTMPPPPAPVKKKARTIHFEEELDQKTPSSPGEKKKAKKPRRTPAVKKAPGERKKSTISSVAAMVSCLSGSNKPAELADIGDDILLSPPSTVRPVTTIVSSDSLVQNNGQKSSDSNHLWLKDSSTHSSFVPKCTDDAFLEECNRLLQTQSMMKEFVDVMTKEIESALSEAHKQRTATSSVKTQSNEETLIKRIRNMEAMMGSLDRKYSTLASKVSQFGQALREHTESQLDLMRRHREFVRNLICHYSHSYTFDPDTPGSHLISDPFILT